MAQIIGVRFKQVGKVYYFDPCGIQTEVGQNVIVETARGVEYGEVALENRDIADGEVVKPLKKVIRLATENDDRVIETNRKRAKEAFRICEQKIQEHHLDMKLVSVEYTFDLNKVLFYFTADGRVDFRDLVKDLASVFRTRIELRQIGVRDEAKVLGGLGICGRPLCCSSFLDDFQPVSINMAKQQNLSLNPTKISGTCGRLMCCLKYEQEAYEELARVTPRQDSTVETPEGIGTVVDVSMLRGVCSVRLDEDSDGTPKTFRCTECRVVQAGRRPKRSAPRPPQAEKPARKVEPVEPTAEEAPKKPVEQPIEPERRRPQPRREERYKDKEREGSREKDDRRRPQRRRRPNGNNERSPEQRKTNDNRPPRRERNERTERPRQERAEFVDATRQPHTEDTRPPRRPRRRRPNKPNGDSSGNKPE